jgi:AraC family transcriptional regulator of adaptative response/methylated-DNA-[protein]-cysteine methyltransferase
MKFRSNFNTPLGEMTAVATEEGLCFLCFSDSVNPGKIADEEPGKQKTEISQEENIHIKNTRIELDEYFEGRRMEFSVSLHLMGTEFQKNVWKGLMNIPYGAVRTYTEQAAAHGKKEIIRAVARANGSNRICIIIPCHRVVGSNGSLTGYAGGLHRKQWLLEHERKNSVIPDGELYFKIS